VDEHVFARAEFYREGPSVPYGERDRADHLLAVALVGGADATLFSPKEGKVCPAFLLHTRATLVAALRGGETGGESAEIHGGIVILLLPSP
jgi:hypothetical protein